jgi:hypothetical protein
MKRRPQKKAAAPRLPDNFTTLDAVGVMRAQLQRDWALLESGKGFDGKKLTQQQYRMMRGSTLSALTALGEITGETLQMPESKVVKLPAFRRLVDAMTKALEAYPEAMTAVAAALERAAGSET